MPSAWGGGRQIAEMRALVIATYGTVCWRCRKPITGKVTVGHVVDRARGGGDGIENLRPECEPCNYSAGARLGNAIRRHRQARRQPSRTW
jgi:5-methylcytosine-specific restriction endonuclease McrA